MRKSIIMGNLEKTLATLNPVEYEVIKKNGWNRKFFKIGKIRIHAVVADNAPKKSPIIILLHGFPEFWFSWRYIMPELSKKFHVIAIDQRGFNLSSKPFRVKKYGLSYTANDAIEVIKKESFEYYHNECGVSVSDPRVSKPNAIVIGHDWGGGLAWQIARWHPKFVSKLIVLNCPPVEVLMGETGKSVRQLMSSYYIFLFQLPFLGEMFLSKFKPVLFKGIGKSNYYKEGRKMTPAYIKAYSYNRGTSGINWYRAALRWVIRGWFKNPPEIKLPVKVIWGTADTALTVDLTKKFPDLVEKGKYSISYLPGVSHWVQQEAPEEVIKEIKEFLF